MDSYEIVDFQPWHSDRIEELEATLFDNAFNGTTIRTEVRSGAACLVVLHEGTVVGYSLCRTEGGLTDVLRVGVDPEHQGRGLGTRLMNRCMQYSPRCMLCVRKPNEGAIKLYKRLGFKVTGELQGSWVMITSP